MTIKSQARYDRYINELRQIFGGKRGWVSITVAARESGFTKAELERVAVNAFGLTVTRSHGSHGTTVSI